MNPLVVLTFLIFSNFMNCILTLNATKMQLKSADELRKINSSNKNIPNNNKIVITEYSEPGKSEVSKFFYSVNSFISTYV